MELQKVGGFLGDVWKIGSIVVVIAFAGKYISDIETRTVLNDEHIATNEERGEKRYKRGLSLAREIKEEHEKLKKEIQKVRLELQYIKGKEGY